MAHMPRYVVWRAENELLDLALSSCRVGSTERTQFVSLGTALAQKLAFLASSQAMLMLQCKDCILSTRECTGASLQLQP